MGCYKFKISEVDVALSRVDGYNEMEEVIVEMRRSSNEGPVSGCQEKLGRRGKHGATCLSS